MRTGPARSPALFAANGKAGKNGTRAYESSREESGASVTFLGKEVLLNREKMALAVGWISIVDFDRGKRIGGQTEPDRTVCLHSCIGNRLLRRLVRSGDRNRPFHAAALVGTRCG